MPIIDTPYHEESKDGEFDPLMKITASTFIVDVLNRQISEQQMAQELAKKGIQLRTEQIGDFIATYGVPKDPEAVQ